MIEKIAEEKINKLEDNIKYLEDISLKVTNSINELKKIINKIDENNQELKIKVSKIFTKLRNAINDREDKLLPDIDQIFNESFFDEKIVKQSEKLPKKIKEYLDKGKKLEKEKGDGVKKLNIFINDCIDIENSITMIKKMEHNIKKCNTENVNIVFWPKDEIEINQIITKIENFGEIVKENKILYINDLNSLIIKDNLKYNKLLKSWINFNNIVEAELLYQLSRDGDKPSKFHEICVIKGPTLTLFIVKDGNIGGIYNPLSWDTTSREKYNNQSFMFNLNKQEKYKNFRNQTSIWCIDHFGPWSVSFGFNNSLKKLEH